MAEGTDPRRELKPMPNTLPMEIHRIVHDAVVQALGEAQVERPAAYPIAVSAGGAAQLLSTSESTVRRMVRNGTLRTLDTGGVGPQLIPTVALFELDPGYRAAVSELHQLRSRVEELESLAGEP